jgi:hypothetical protein
LDAGINDEQEKLRAVASIFLTDEGLPDGTINVLALLSKRQWARPWSISEQDAVRQYLSLYRTRIEDDDDALLAAAFYDFAEAQLSDDAINSLASLAARQWEQPWSIDEQSAFKQYLSWWQKYTDREEEDPDDDEIDEVVPWDSSMQPTIYHHYNVIERIHFTGGIIGLFVSDETNVQSCIDRLNNSGYRVKMMLPAGHSFLSLLLSTLLLVVTLFLYTRMPGYLVIGEKIVGPEANE